MDEVKEVSSGYARNFLLPKGVATIATPELIAEVEARRAQREAEMANQKETYTKQAEVLADQVVTINAKANPQGVLFAGIDAGQIAQAVTDQLKTAVTADQIMLEVPIKHVGEHMVQVVFLKDISTPVTVKVVEGVSKP